MDDQNPFQDSRSEADVMRLIRQSYGPGQRYEPPFQHNPDAVPNDRLSVPGPYDAVRPLHERAGRAVLDYGPLPAQMAVEVAKQPYNAGVAVGEAAHDPSLANLTNAGVQTAMTLGAPMKAAGVMTGGMITAAMQDLPSFTGSANAQTAGKKGGPAPVEMPGLSAAENSEAILLQAKVDARSTTRIDRERLKQLQDQSGVFSSGKNANELAAASAKQKSAQRDYDSQVAKAEQMRDAGLARKRQFSDTEVGKVYDKAAGHMPIVGGVLGGAVAKTARAAMLGGAAGGVTAANIPTAYDSYFTDVANPERQAYFDMARELPDGHPKKAEAMQYALSLPEANPVRKQAQKELYDPAAMAGRVAFGAVEGAGAGHFVHGAMRGGGIGDLIEGAARLPGRAVKGMRGGMADSRPQEPFVTTTPNPIPTPTPTAKPVSRYDNVDPSMKTDIRAVYRDQVGSDGLPLADTRAIVDRLAPNTISNAALRKRNDATTVAVQEAMAKAGVQRPKDVTDAQWDAIFKRATLGLGAGGVGLAAQQSPFQFTDGTQY